MQQTLQQELIKFLELIGFTNPVTDGPVISDSPKKEGDQHLGEMNMLEKTCFKLIEAKKAEHKVLHKKLEATKPDSDEYAVLEREHQLCIKSGDIAREIMWGSMRTRFNLPTTATGIALRDGGLIVATTEKQEDEMDDFPFGLMGALFGGNMMVVKVGVS